MMKKEMQTLFVLCAISIAAGIAGAQQVTGTSQSSASNDTSVSSSRPGLDAQSATKTNASNATSIASPERIGEAQEPKETRPVTPGDSRKKTGEGSGGLSSGTTVNAILSRPVDSGKCKPGDRVEATAAQDVKSHGKVVIPRGSHLVGHVTEAKSKSQGEAGSSLGVVFDHAVLKGGRRVPMNSVVQALAAAQTSSSASAADDTFGALNSGTVATRGSAATGGSLVGGITSTAASATGGVANVGGGATNAASSTLGAGAGVGNGLQSGLGSSSNGVIGLKGLALASEPANSAQGSLITSSSKTVHLDSGTQMVLRVVNQ